MMAEPMLDSVIDAFIDGYSDFEKFSRGVERHLSRFPEQREDALRRLDALKASGRLTAALHGLIAQEIERGSSGDLTPPLGADKDQADVALEAVAPAQATKTGGEAKAEVEDDTAVMPASASPVPPGVGTVLGGRYRVKALLARGGMSLIYSAEDQRRDGPAIGGATVCIKLLAPEFAGRPEARRSLEREALLLGGVNHPGIVRMLDFHDQDPVFLVTELLDGERLRDLIARHGAMPSAWALPILLQLAEALACLHGRGLVHRDVKPANVLVTSAGRVRLIDFGLATAAGRPEDGPGPAMKSGTPLYASPEMLGGRAADPRDDVYGLGCVAYEMFTGSHPWGKLPADVAARRSFKPKRPAGLPGFRWKALRHSLALKAADRPKNASMFLAEFFPQTPPRQLAPWAAAALLGGIAVAVATFMLGTDSPPDPAPGPSPQADSPALLETPDEPLDVPIAAPDARDERPESPPETPEAPAEAPQARVEAAGTPAEQVEPEAAPAATPPVAETAEAAEAGEEAEATQAREAAPARESVQAARPPAPAALAFTSGTYRISEGGSALRLAVPRPAGHVGPMSVLWRTLEGTAQHDRNFAGAPEWRLATAPANADAILILIPIVDDSVKGPDLTFHVELSRTSGGPEVGAPARALVTIVDDD